MLFDAQPATSRHEQTITTQARATALSTGLFRVWYVISLSPQSVLLEPIEGAEFPLIAHHRSIIRVLPGLRNSINDKSSGLQGFPLFSAAIR